MIRDGLMGKFEALMRKHRGGAEAADAQLFQAEQQAPSPDVWLPVLTDVVQRGSPPDAVEEQPRPVAAPAAQEALEPDIGGAPPIAGSADEISATVEPSTEPNPVSEPVVAQEAAPESASEAQDAQVAARLVDELAPKITDLMQEQVAEELRKSLNQSMSHCNGQPERQYGRTRAPGGSGRTRRKRQENPASQGTRQWALRGQQSSAFHDKGSASGSDLPLCIIQCFGFLSSMDLAKSFEPREIEARWYDHWAAAGYFQPSGNTAQPAFCIQLPPPNVTGTLHMGHAFNQTIMDGLTRYHRMLGHNTLWLPGTDHAGIATQIVVERQLEKEG